MAAILLEKCTALKEVLEVTPKLPPHNWLVSALECCDYCDWEGSEKWAQDTLFLTDEELRHDVELRKMQIIWGAFSALPGDITEETAYSYELPYLDGNSDFMREYIVPRHPLAYLEVSVIDSSYTVISAKDATLLEPFYALPYRIRDMGRENQRLNADLRRIQTLLRTVAPTVSAQLANEVQWICWRKRFRESEKPVEDGELLVSIREVLSQVSVPGYKYRYSFWDPFQAE